MATRTFCDKCHTQASVAPVELKIAGWLIGVHIPATELCRGCWMALADWLKPDALPATESR